MKSPLITLRAKLSGTVYCYQSCLWVSLCVCVCGCVVVVVDFIERITQTPLMRYVSLCTTDRRVINADMRLSMLSVGSRRNSGNEYPDDWTRDGQRSTTKTCCDGVVARSADDSRLIARAALTARNVRCTHLVCGSVTMITRNCVNRSSPNRVCR